MQTEKDLAFKVKVADELISAIQAALAAQSAAVGEQSQIEALCDLLEIALDEYETANGRTKSLPHWSRTARNILEARQALQVNHERD